MRQTATLLAVLLVLAVSSAAGEGVYIDGFVQGLFGGRLDEDNPTATEQTASETRLQLRAEHFGDKGEFFGRLDFTYDGADTADYDWELREAYLKFRAGDNLDFKIGRQILTWGTGDLIFINDVFAKDYRSFFIGRDDQYLKAPQTAIRTEYYLSAGSISFVWTPRFEPNRLPYGRRLSYYSPMAGGFVGEGFFFDPPTPPAKFENGEFAFRFSRQTGGFNTSLYFYKGFYKNPLGFSPTEMTAVYPKVNIWGASIRGSLAGGVLWIESGYFDSRQDSDGDNPYIPNSSLSGLLGFERQVATNLTVNGQWQLDHMFDHELFSAQQAPGAFVRNELRHLLTSRVTKTVNSETIILSGFVFFSPTDEDAYARLSVEYKYSDEISLMAGANAFDGNHANTEFGQFALNDNAYIKVTYGF